MDWSKEEYAELSWRGIKEYIAELDESACDDRSKMFRLMGWMNAYYEVDKELRYDFEIH